MYFGHYAVAVAVKAKKPEMPVMPLFLATGAIDIVNGLFIMAGIDQVSGDLEAKPYLYFDLNQIDWDHSLLMGLVWSFLAAFLAYAFCKKSKEIGIIAGLVAFSHWLLDVPVHNADLALYPGSAIKFGWGLWGSLGTYAWHFEVAFSLLLLAYAFYISKKRGELIWGQLILMGLLMVNMSPWLSPMKIVASFPEPYAHLVHGFLVFIGFVIPAFIFNYLYRRSGAKANQFLKK